MTDCKRLSLRRARRAAGAAALGMAAMVAGGCHGERRQDPRVHGDAFRPEDETRAVTRFADAQVAVGARADATLRPYHFDCADLNSLGQHKLDSMLKDDGACAPLVVYLDVPEGPEDNYDARREALSVYLKDRGLQESQVKVVRGPNVASLAPTAPLLRAKKLLDTGAPVAVNPEPTGSAGAAAAPAGR